MLCSNQSGYRRLLTSLALASIAAVCLQCKTAASTVNKQGCAAKEAQQSDSNRIQIASGLSYERVEIDPLAIAHVVRVDTASGAWSIRPCMSEQIETTSTLARELGALVAINGGFFNLSDGESASYIVVDGKQVCEPKHNMALVNNASLKPFLTRIFNRSELRFLEDKSGKTSIKIQPHADSVPAGLKLIHSLQAGPQILPEITSKHEAFVRRAPGATKDSDSIGTAMRAARTAFGITGDGTAVLVCVQGLRTKEFSEGISLAALADFMRRIGCQSAINFDGGSSTTMVVRLPDTPSAPTPEQSRTVVSSSPERKVKSILYVVPRNTD